ncbi:MAG TPA: glycine--tRNA ligase subunit beta [Aliidongia sp.]|nr:glycine--tRNA ligase subunit beta [Aliidongia sp.]
MPDFLLELFSEEIPARMQARAAEDLRRLVETKLAALDLAGKKAQSFAGPRRLTLVIEGLPERQPDRTVELKGPRVGAPEQALAGFLRSAGLPSIEACEIRETEKGKFYFAVSHVGGRSIETALAELLGEVLDTFPWPKSMRWASHDVRWVRPLHNILAILTRSEGTTIVPFAWALDRTGDKPSVLSANDASFGHRFLAPARFTVASFEDYRERLRAAKVMLSAEERKALILEKGARLAEAEGLRVKLDPELLDEVAGLAEWPVVRLGRIEQGFMSLPHEVLTTSMRTHQKYFACETGEGVVAPFFIVVGNNETRDGGIQMIAGNERVLRARLSDAQFFWNLDRQSTLESRVAKLGERVFHAKLGSVRDKVTRMIGLVEALVPYVPGADRSNAERAVLLAKADLSSALVGEFPELQGIMGRYLALNDGEKPAIAEAVARHYAPAGIADATPAAPLDIVAALADKLDTLAGFFAIDEKPTGSKDPFALRRAALGVIRIVLDNGLRLPLAEVLAAALRLHAIGTEEAQQGVAAGLLDFFADRLKVFLREQGVRHDLVAAIFALGGEDDLVRLLARVRALQGFLGSDDGANLLTAYRRASRIVGIEEKKDGVGYRDPVDPSQLSVPEERILVERLEAVGRSTDASLHAEDYTGAMAEMASLRRPVDDFFDKVTVNSDSPSLRSNRLRLLARIWTVLNRVADFSKIEG